MSSITLEEKEGKDGKVKVAKEEVKEAELKVEKAELKVEKAEKWVKEAKQEVKEAELKVEKAEKKLEEAVDQGKGQSVIDRITKTVERCQRRFDTEHTTHSLANEALALALQVLKVAEKRRIALLGEIDKDAMYRLIAQSPSIKFHARAIASIDANSFSVFDFTRPPPPPKQGDRKNGIRKAAALHYRVWAANGKRCQCQISGRWGDNTQVTTSHLLKHCSPQHLKNVFEIDDINDFRNLLLLATGIDKAYEQGRIYFEFKDERTFLMRIYDDSVKTEPIFAGCEKTVGDFEGSKLQIPHGVDPPYKRVLSHHAQAAYQNALKEGWIDRNAVGRPEEYGSPLKDNMLSFSQIDSVGMEEEISWKGSLKEDGNCTRTQTETGPFSEDD